MPTYLATALVCLSLPFAAAARPEPRMSYIGNAHLKVGVDLALGGAITHLSVPGGPNLINSYDFGRQVQMSHYAGPVPYSEGGNAPHPAWTHIGWNPIQTGDVAGNPSRLLSHENSGTSLHVRCIPMQWPLDNVPGTCVFDWRLFLEGSLLRVSATLTNQRTDRILYAARSQELPAVYTNAPWHRLFSYTGSAPFTSGPPAEIPRRRTPPRAFPWSRFQATENWAALLDSTGVGLGVYTPGTQSFLGGFAGEPGTGGPRDSPAGYIAPVQSEILDHNISYTYQFYLIPGSLKEIRSHVYRLAKFRPRSLSFTFSNNRQHWTYAGGITDSGWPLPGHLDLALASPDSRLTSPPGCWHTSTLRSLRVTMAVDSGSATGHAAILVRPFGGDGFSHTAQIPVVADGKFHTYTVDLPSASGFVGTVNQIAIKPFLRASSGDRARIRSVLTQIPPTN